MLATVIVVCVTVCFVVVDIYVFWCHYLFSELYSVYSAVFFILEF